MWCGVALGLALLAKGTAITVAPIIAAAVVLGVGWRVERAQPGALIAVPALVLSAPWYVFLYRTYGNFSGFPQRSRLQDWNRPEGGFFDALQPEFVIMRFRETWGEFGWRQIPLEGALLLTIGAPLLLAASGVLLLRSGRR